MTQDVNTKNLNTKNKGSNKNNRITQNDNKADRAARSQNAVDQIIHSLKDKPGALLPILHAIQQHLGFIPADVQPVIARSLNLSNAEVHGVVSFYHFFRTTAPGRNTIQVCRAESCQAMGSRELESHVKSTLGIDYHQTTADGEFTLKPVYCLGNCACSPAMRVNDDVLGNVDKQTFDALVDQLTTSVVEVQ